jgi:hypothetical protein
MLLYRSRILPIAQRSYSEQSWGYLLDKGELSFIFSILGYFLQAAAAL